MLDIFFATLLVCAVSLTTLVLQYFNIISPANLSSTSSRAHQVGCVIATIVGCLMFGPLDYLIGTIIYTSALFAFVKVLIKKGILVEFFTRTNVEYRS